MTDEEAVAWCAEHEATVEFSYIGHTLDGKGHFPRVTIRADYSNWRGRMGLVTIKFEAETFCEAVSGAKAQFDLAASREP